MTTSRNLRIPLLERKAELLRQLKLDPTARDSELAQRMGLKQRYVKIILKALRDEKLVATATKRHRLANTETWWNQRIIFVKE